LQKCRCCVQPACPFYLVHSLAGSPSAIPPCAPPTMTAARPPLAPYLQSCNNSAGSLANCALGHSLPITPINQVCHVYFYLLPRACCALAPQPLHAYCAHLASLCAAHVMDWSVSPYIYLSHHLCLSAPVVVLWGSFHRDRLFAVTREINCAPSCALSADCRLYAALGRMAVMTESGPIGVGLALSECYTPLTPLVAATQYLLLWPASTVPSHLCLLPACAFNYNGASTQHCSAHIIHHSTHKHYCAPAGTLSVRCGSVLAEQSGCKPAYLQFSRCGPCGCMLCIVDRTVSISRLYTQSPCVGVMTCRSISSVHGPVHPLLLSVRLRVERR
jgi:hypothetical protein